MVLGVGTFKKIDVEGRDAWEHVVEIDLALGVDTEDTGEIVAVKDCRWEDTSYVVAGRHHPLCKKPKLKLSDTLAERWAILPKGTGPFHGRTLRCPTWSSRRARSWRSRA